MFSTLRELHTKLDEVIGRQERSLSLISQIQVGGNVLHTADDRPDEL